MLTRSLKFFAFTALVFTTAAAPAQDSLFAELYGQGVHAYYSGDDREAHKLLTTAIEGGTDDPRAFYFRGFAAQRLGRRKDARADFREGAILEAYGDARESFRAYFSGDLERAHKLLTDEIVEGTADPRFFYFRGLTYEKLKRPVEAKADLKRAAELGLRGNQRTSYPIGRSLQRIQGKMRLQLEDIRRQVRLTARSSLTTR